MADFGDSNVKPFRDLMTENNEFRRALIPAIKHASTGKVFIGKRGLAHIDIRYSHPEEDGSPLKGEAGYWHTLKKQFYPKYGKEGLNIDSTQLDPKTGLDQGNARAHYGDTTDHMSSVQRMRQFGTESVEYEFVDMQKTPEDEYNHMISEKKS